jgi:hypothetical protein
MTHSAARGETFVSRGGIDRLTSQAGDERFTA